MHGEDPLGRQFTLTEPDDEGQRADNTVARKLAVTLGEARRLIARGLVRVSVGKSGNEWRRPKKGDRLALGDTIEIDGRIVFELQAGGKVARRAPVPQPELPLRVLYEDELLLGVDKLPGLPSHPLLPGERGTMANAIIARFPACAEASEDPREAGLVHRLDLSTSGVLIAAKTRAAWTELRRAFRASEIDKIYWAVVEGDPGATPRVLDAPLATKKGLARADADGLAARTEVRVLVRGHGFALVEARARSGRLHQVRAHLALAGHPLIGDTRYGARHLAGVADDAPLLHARAISLPHPRDGWVVPIAAPLPDERRVLAERLLGHALP